MKNPILYIQKVLVLPLAVMILFLSFGAEKTHAQGIFVPVNDGILITGSFESFLFQDVLKMSLDILSYQAGQIALNELNNNTLSWIKGGFGGSSAFAVDPAKLFLDLAGANATNLAGEIRNLPSFNFSPTFDNDFANAIELSTRSDSANKFAAELQSPFPALGVDPAAFYSDFNQGGWSAFEASLSDSGNPFGVSLIASRELATRQEEATKLQEQKLAWSGGFMDLVDTGNCTYPAQVQQLMDQEGDLDPASTAAYQQQYCKTITPGKTIQDQLSQTLGTDIQRLGFADNLNKVISAFIQQLSQEAISGIFK